MARSRNALSVTSEAAAVEFRSMKATGYSTRRIAQLSGVGKSMVQDVITGKRNLSTARASAALAEIATRQPRALLAGNDQAVPVKPLTKRDTSNMAKHWRALQRAKKTGDFSKVPRLKINTEEGVFYTNDNTRQLEEAAAKGALDVEDPLHYDEKKVA